MTVNRSLIRLEIKQQLGAWLLDHAEHKVAAVAGIADAADGRSPAVSFLSGGAERTELTADGGESLSAFLQVFLRVRLDAHEDPELVLDNAEYEIGRWVEAHREGAHYQALEWWGKSEVEPLEAEDGTPWLWERITLHAQGRG